MSILPIALSFAGDVMRNAMISRNQDRTAQANSAASRSSHIQGFSVPVERLSSLKQEHQAGQMVANLHNDAMREQRFEHNRNQMSKMLAS